MEPYGLELIRIYTTESGRDIADSTPLKKGGTTFDVIVEAECGDARLDEAPYDVQIFARDFYTGTNPASVAANSTFTQVNSGKLFAADGWPKYRHRFTVTIGDINAVNDHPMEYVAVMHGAGGQYAKFVTSALFLIQQ